MKHNDQYLAECVTPAFHHQRQAYAGCLKLDHYERQPPAKYFKPAIGNDALPHAGFLESSFRKQSFDGDDYSARRYCCAFTRLYLILEFILHFFFHVLINLFTGLPSIVAQTIKGLFMEQVASPI